MGRHGSPRRACPCLECEAIPEVVDGDESGAAVTVRLQTPSLAEVAADWCDKLDSSSGGIAALTGSVA